MKNAFVTLLATEDFLPGVLTLNRSLRNFNKNCHLVVMVTTRISAETVNVLEAAGCAVKIVQEIDSPVITGADPRGFKHTYTKLRIFSLTEYDKVVYLDSDMVVCGDLRSLFAAPHISAVAAGGLMPENSSWKNLNSGLLVIEPSIDLFNRMLSAINSTGSIDGGDQGFLQLYYPRWHSDNKLHLPHEFNVPFIYIDAYCAQFAYKFSYIKRRLDTDLAVIHYWGPVKPWHSNVKKFSRRDRSKQIQAIILWWDLFDEALKEIDDA